MGPGSGGNGSDASVSAGASRRVWSWGDTTDDAIGTAAANPAERQGRRAWVSIHSTANRTNGSASISSARAPPTMPVRTAPVAR